MNTPCKRKKRDILVGILSYTMTTITLSKPAPEKFPTSFIDIDDLRNALFQYDLEVSMEKSKNSPKEKFVNL